MHLLYTGPGGDLSDLYGPVASLGSEIYRSGWVPVAVTGLAPEARAQHCALKVGDVAAKTSSDMLFKG